MLIIKNEVLEKIITHLRETYPEEGCGFLLGKDETVYDIIRAENVTEENRRRRYEMKPLDFLKAEKEAKKSSLNVIGFYHSHPDTGLYFSDTDASMAWEGYYYVVVALKGNGGYEMGAWIKRGDSIEKIEINIKRR